MTDLKRIRQLEKSREMIKALQAELEQTNSELMHLTLDLEDRVAARTRELEIANKNLIRSNEDLEKFAYIASHDLQEPLRMISSFTQLLARRYRNQLDQDADEFIDYIVNGTQRMKQLINDLLDFSRVKTRGKPFIETSLDIILASVKQNLMRIIKENTAQITHDPLPAVAVDPSQLSHVLQNLIANGIKFRSQEIPHIHISAKKQESDYIISVKDNGIGIEPEYFDTIFIIFKRLHSISEYPGTGIGLAISKRIVERHGGKIWVESEPGKGSTFYFSLPGVIPNDHGI